MQGQQLHEIFVSRVKTRRQELGLTQKQVALRMKVSQAYVASMENGTTMPGLNVVAKFAEALNTSPSALLTAEEIFSGAY